MGLRNQNPENSGEIGGYNGYIMVYSSNWDISWYVDPLVICNKGKFTIFDRPR